MKLDDSANCAYCGESLENSACRLIVFLAVPGSPRVYWHAESCYHDEELHDELRVFDVDELIKHLQTIEERGPNRVFAKEQWGLLAAQGA